MSRSALGRYRRARQRPPPVRASIGIPTVAVMLRVLRAPVCSAPLTRRKEPQKTPKEKGKDKDRYSNSQTRPCGSQLKEKGREEGKSHRRKRRLKRQARKSLRSDMPSMRSSRSNGTVPKHATTHAENISGTRWHRRAAVAPAAAAVTTAACPPVPPLSRTKKLV